MTSARRPKDSATLVAETLVRMVIFIFTLLLSVTNFVGIFFFVFGRGLYEVVVDPRFRTGNGTLYEAIVECFRYILEWLGDYYDYARNARERGNYSSSITFEIINILPSGSCPYPRPRDTENFGAR